MEDERLKWVSLFVALFVVSVALYRWILMKWRSDVSLRKYAFIKALNASQSVSPVILEIEIPEPQSVKVELFNQVEEEEDNVFEEVVEGGVLNVKIHMQGKSPGIYEVIIKTQDQKDIKRFEWTG